MKQSLCSFLDIFWSEVFLMCTEKPNVSKWIFQYLYTFAHKNQSQTNMILRWNRVFHAFLTPEP